MFSANHLTKWVPEKGIAVVFPRSSDGTAVSANQVLLRVLVCSRAADIFSISFAKSNGFAT